MTVGAVPRRFQQIVLSWLLILAIGGHWPLLQSVAWVKMLVSFSQTDDLKTAVKKTFDGNHPCNLCLIVKKGKETEGKQAVELAKLKIDYFLAAAEPLFFRLPLTVETSFAGRALSPRSFSPALPPPKLA